MTDAAAIDISRSSLGADPVDLYARAERGAIAAGALIMLGIVAASLLIAARTDADLGDAARSQSIRAASVDLMQQVTLAETGQRGYLLTGKTTYLQPYNSASAAVPTLLDTVGKAIPNDPEALAWRAVIDRKMAELARTVQLAQAGRRAEALAVVDSDRGQRDMDNAVAIAGRLAARQRSTLTADLARSQSGARILVGVDAAAFVILACLVLFVGRRAQLTFRQLASAQLSLLALNDELEAGRNRLEQAVEERTSDLTEANAELQRFAYIVSHDLRAPLLNIIGFTAELEMATSRLNRFVTDNLAGIPFPREVREASEQDLPEAIRFIQTSTSKMDRLIGAILRLSRQGRRVLTPEPIDMADLLSGIADSMRHQAAAADAEITIADVPLLVSDRIAVEQIFSNLIENALKYAQPGRPGRIRIEGALKGTMLCYSVTDNGRGIQERDLDRIFDLFRRAGNQDQPGEGIGLAHVRALVRRLGGNICCASALGNGSSFTICLPDGLSTTRFMQRLDGNNAGRHAGDATDADVTNGVDG